MAATYDLTDTTLNRVRLLLADTDITAPLLQDEEINLLLTMSGGVSGSDSGCLQIAAQFARKADMVEVSEMQIRYTRNVDHYRNLALELKQRLAGATALNVYSGGQTAPDGSPTAPSFTRQQFSNETDGIFTHRYDPGS